MKSTVYVFGDWSELKGSTLIGTLAANLVRGKEHFSFAYDDTWLLSDHVKEIDPELSLYQGEQHNLDESNFRVFLDSCPDRWGRLLMNRRESMMAKFEERPVKRLLELDYLLGVHDQYRMGALRFKKDINGNFLAADLHFQAPPFSSLRELNHAKEMIEEGDLLNEEYYKWLSMLISPGSSLGGARPKANVIDTAGHLWIAKFPSKHDELDLGLWEYLAHQLAVCAGINMSECSVMKLGNRFHTFLTKRFDRDIGRRIHFSSALMQLGYYDGNYEASYLEIAEFLMCRGSDSKVDLKELFTRIVFNIAISNVDDHLRNHGFLLEQNGWRLSPAYDLNPTPIATGLTLNIDDKDNRLDYELAHSVCEYFQLGLLEAKEVIDRVKSSVSKWPVIAKKIGLSRMEMDQMQSAFNI